MHFLFFYFCAEEPRKTGSFQQGPGGWIQRMLAVCVEQTQWVEHVDVWEKVSVANRKSRLMDVLFASHSQPVVE